MDGPPARPLVFGDSQTGATRNIPLPEGTGDYPFSFPGFFRKFLTAYAISGTQGEPGLESFRYAVRLIADGAIDVSPLLSHMLPIEKVDEAYRMAHDRTDGALKVSIRF